MSRFADPEDRIEVELGPCECPDTPHRRDTAVIRRQLGYAAMGRIGMAGIAEGRNGAIDPTATMRSLLLESVVSWNLLGPDGKAWPPTAASIAELDSATVEHLAGLINEQSRLKALLPNASAGRSRTGSSATRSRTRETPAAPISTTSS